VLTSFAKTFSLSDYIFSDIVEVNIGGVLVYRYWIIRWELPPVASHWLDHMFVSIHTNVLLHTDTRRYLILAHKSPAYWHKCTTYWHTNVLHTDTNVLHTGTPIHYILIHQCTIYWYTNVLHTCTYTQITYLVHWCVNM
jgi:hypothetical protein